MKKGLTILIFCLLVLSFAACGKTQNEPSRTDDEHNVATQGQEQDYTFSLPPGADVFYGLIVANTGDTLLVTKNETEGKTSGLYTLSSQYLDSKQDASMLVPGTYFKLCYGGYIMESYPMQFGSPVVFICEQAKEDIVTPLMKFVLEKIPSDAKWIALDFSDIEELSDGEKEAILYLLECNKTVECGVVRYDPSYLSAEELLTNENSPDGGAVLKLEAQLQNNKLIGTWKLTDSEQVTTGELALSVPYYLN